MVLIMRIVIKKLNEAVLFNGGETNLRIKSSLLRITL